MTRPAPSTSASWSCTPQHERADEAHYYLGMAYVRAADAPDRDQTYTRRVWRSSLCWSARCRTAMAGCSARIAVARRKLAEKICTSGGFYFDRGNYAAAVGRFKSLLANYDAAGFDDQACTSSRVALAPRAEGRGARCISAARPGTLRNPVAPAAAKRLDIALVRTGPPLPRARTSQRMRQALETWDELSETVRSYRSSGDRTPPAVSAAKGVGSTTAWHPKSTARPARDRGSSQASIPSRDAPAPRPGPQHDLRQRLPHAGIRR
jgi:hypothetical protein